MSASTPISLRRSKSSTPQDAKRNSNIFICFAPEEREFARDLDEALRKRRRVSDIDWLDTQAETTITPEGLQRIDTAKTFIFIVSPASIASEVCRRQLDHAVQTKKALVSVVRKPVDDASLPAALRSVPAIDYREERDYLTAFEEVIKAANTNLRIDVFLCYSRVDKVFVNRLYEGLVAAGRRVWLDLSSIPTSTVWAQEIDSGIQAADNFVLIISPDSMRAESFCHKEFAHATKHNKRIIPLYHRPTDAALIPPKLAQYQRRDFPADGDFDADLQRLLDDLDQDLGYLREHTRLLTRALEWQRGNNEASLLLRGKDLRQAENLLRSAGKEPQFTDLQRQYVRASRQAANRIRNKVLAGVAGGLILTTILSVGLYFQQQNAKRRGLLAKAHELVRAAESNINTDGQLSLRLAIEAADRYIAAQGQLDEGTISLLKRGIFAAVPRVNTETEGIEAVAWRPNGESLAAGSSDGHVLIISAVDNSVVHRFDSNGGIRSLSWTADGALLAVGTEENVVVWDAFQKKLSDPMSFDNPVWSVSWRKDTTQLAVAVVRGRNADIKVVDWKTRAILFEVDGIRASWSPDGRLLATGRSSGLIRVFDSTGKFVSELPGHKRTVHDIAWTYDSKRFATTSFDQLIVWDAVSLKPVTTLTGDYAIGVAWNFDASRLATASGANLVSIWDGKTYEPLQDFTSANRVDDPYDITRRTNFFFDVDWSFDGRILTVSDRGDPQRGRGPGTVLLLPAILFNSAKGLEWLTIAKSVGNRQLTTDECARFLEGNCKPVGPA